MYAEEQYSIQVSDQNGVEMLTQKFGLVSTDVTNHYVGSEISEPLEGSPECEGPPRFYYKVNSRTSAEIL